MTIQLVAGYGARVEVLMAACVGIYVTVVVSMSILTFLAYGWDKRQARRNHRRISERTLHRLALAGGWPGAWAGQQFFRHKTAKRSFLWRYWSIVLVHLVLIGCVIYWWLGRDA